MYRLKGAARMGSHGSTSAEERSKVIVNYEDPTATMTFLVDYLNRQEEPFDGICGFS